MSKAYKCDRCGEYQDEETAYQHVDADRVLHKIAHKKRHEAMEVVKDRIERKTDNEGREYLYDPVSKYRHRSGWDNDFGDEEIHREMLAEKIIQP